MNHERNLGVSQAGLALTLLLCLLVVLGYMILHNLGSTETPIVEIRPGFVTEPARVAGVAAGEEQPQVLTVESSDVPGQALRTPSDESELR